MADSGHPAKRRRVSFSATGDQTRTYVPTPASDSPRPAAATSARGARGGRRGEVHRAFAAAAQRGRVHAGAEAEYKVGLVVDDLVLEVEVLDEAEREYATSRAEQHASLAFPFLDEVQEERRKARRLPLLVNQTRPCVRHRYPFLLPSVPSMPAGSCNCGCCRAGFMDGTPWCSDRRCCRLRRRAARRDEDEEEVASPLRNPLAAAAGGARRAPRLRASRSAASKAPGRPQVRQPRGNTRLRETRRRF